MPVRFPGGLAEVDVQVVVVTGHLAAGETDLAVAGEPQSALQVRLDEDAPDPRLCAELTDEFGRRRLGQPPRPGGRRVGRGVMASNPDAHPIGLPPRRLEPAVPGGGRGPAQPPTAILVEDGQVDLAAVAMADVRRHRPPPRGPGGLHVADHGARMTMRDSLGGADERVAGRGRHVVSGGGAVSARDGLQGTAKLARQRYEAVGGGDGGGAGRRGEGQADERHGKACRSQSASSSVSSLAMSGGSGLSQRTVSPVIG